MDATLIHGFHGLPHATGYMLPDAAWEGEGWNGNSPTTLKPSCSITLQWSLGYDWYKWPAVMAGCLGGGNQKPLILLKLCCWICSAERAILRRPKSKVASVLVATGLVYDWSTGRLAYYWPSRHARGLFAFGGVEQRDMVSTRESARHGPVSVSVATKATGRTATRQWWCCWSCSLIDIPMDYPLVSIVLYSTS